MSFISVFQFAGLIFVFLLTLFCFTGCASTNSPSADIPWNIPQSWEGAPSVPGIQ